MHFWAIVGSGLFFSVGWSNIFSLAIKDLGGFTSQGSALLVMAIVGGAIIPGLQSFVIESHGVQLSFVIPFCRYGISDLLWIGRLQNQKLIKSTVMKNKSLLFALFCFLPFACEQSSKSSDQEIKQLTQYVNTFIGTGGHGHTYPGASMPFGMVQLSPDTRLEGWDGCGGYHYTDSVVYGFSHTHLSGTGVPDYGDILLMPTTGEIQFDNGYKKNPDEGYASRFSHEEESASPGYYAVKLADYDIDVALTVSPRAGFHQYIFNQEGPANVIVDLEHRDMLLDADFQIVDKQTVQGKRISKAWASEQHVYFYIQFSKEFASSELSSRVINGTEKSNKGCPDIRSKCQ